MDNEATTNRAEGTMNQERQAFELGFVNGVENGAASPNEAAAALRAARLEDNVENGRCFLNGNDDGVAGDAWRLDQGRRHEQELLEGLGLR